MVVPWSRCTATGTVAALAAAIISGPSMFRGWCFSRVSAHWMMMGARISSAAEITPMTHSRLATEKEPTA